jgi:hypothetical protein
MKIDAPGSVRTNSVRRKDKSQNGQGSEFAKHISSGSDATPVAGGSGASQLGSVEALVALQEAPDASQQTKPPDAWPKGGVMRAIRAWLRLSMKSSSGRRLSWQSSQ